MSLRVRGLPLTGRRELLAGLLMVGWQHAGGMPVSAPPRQGQHPAALCVEIPGLDISEDLDVWHHGIAAGLMQRATPAQG